MWRGYLLDQGEGRLREVNLDELLGPGFSNTRIVATLGRWKEYFNAKILFLEWWDFDGEEYRGSVAITSLADPGSITGYAGDRPWSEECS